MEYKSLKDIPYFNDCSAVMDSVGFKLVELHILSKDKNVSVTAVIASKDPLKDIGVSDCSVAHHALIPKITELLNKTEDDISMEVCSPGIERTLKNAAEFGIFQSREVRVFSKDEKSWIRGTIKFSDENQVTLKTEDGSEKSVVYNDIAKAKFTH